MRMRACESDTMTDAAPPAVKVLVVEDDRELGPLLLRLFRGAGYEPDLAPDGQAGLHLALTRHYNAMVLDRGLPAVEGLDLLRLLAQNPARAFTREQIVTEVFPDTAGVALIDTYVHYLRRSLGAAAIATVRGVGYRLGSG